MEGWIKLYRKFSEWEWFNISEMVHLFIYLLLNANHEQSTWRGIIVKRGQIITGLNTLNEKTGISIRSLRTCLDRLQNTKEIDRQTTNKYSLITICNYESYQGNTINSDKQPDKQPTSNRQAIDKQPTTNKNNKEEKELKNETINIEFDAFWNLYAKKVGDKERCRKKWNKLTDKDRQMIIDTLPEFISSIRDKQFQPFPEKYLSQKRWNDEIMKEDNHRVIGGYYE